MQKNLKHKHTMFGVGTTKHSLGSNEYVGVRCCLRLLIRRAIQTF